MRAFVTTMIFALVTHAIPAWSASFDCSKASTEVEIAICNDPELSALDELMAAIYKLSRKTPKYQNTVLEEQRAWIVKRDENWNNFQIRPRYDKKAHLAVDMTDRIGALFETLVGIEYKTILNLFNEKDGIAIDVDAKKRIILFSFGIHKKKKRQEYNHALFFDPNLKLAKATMGDVYGNVSACEDLFRLKNGKLTGLSHSLSCGRHGRHGYTTITYALAPKCIQLKNIRKSSGMMGPDVNDGSWNLNENKEICLEGQNYELDVDYLLLSDDVHFQSPDEFLANLKDYWLNAPTKSMENKVEGCSTSSKIFTQYALSSVSYSDLIAEYEENRNIYDLFLPVIKTIDGDGSVKKLASLLLKSYENPQIVRDQGCLAMTKGNFHRDSYFYLSGFWNRREIDGTIDQTLEILRKLQNILAD
ncbi:lysozyme inhibitor LprI family protein [Amylibacter sp.]|nr:lysozyme inhibitor LprI family protein [Amylibacter sp.]